MTGLVRAEWMLARYAQVIPTNWSQQDFIAWVDQYSPVGYMVADARNICVKTFLASNSEWLVFIDHDVVLPCAFFMTLNERIKKEDVPCWSGLYFTKAYPSEPLVYRNWGRSYDVSWKMGDIVPTVGVPMGCTVIHHSLLDVMWAESPEYAVGDQVCRRVFDTPAKMWMDPVNQQWLSARGTEDLDWCRRVVEGSVFERAGWKKQQKMKFPFLVDTNIFCRHITPDGVMYPSKGEEQFFMRSNGRTGL